MGIVPRRVKIDNIIIYDVFDGDIWIAAFGNEKDAKDFIAMIEYIACL